MSTLSSRRELASMLGRHRVEIRVLADARPVFIRQYDIALRLPEGLYPVGLTYGAYETTRST